MMKITYLYLIALTMLCSIAFSQISKPDIDSLIQREVDPYFVQTFDTIAAFGPSTITRSILQDKKGNMWFATWQGIMKYDGKEFTNYTLKDNLKHFHVFSIFEDSAGNLWFGTVRGGIYRYDGEKFKLFTTNEGLAGNTVSCMLQDSKGRIWFGTEKGLSVLQSYSTSVFTNFDVNDGLSNNEINSIAKDPDGNIWLGTKSGINRCIMSQTLEEIKKSKFSIVLNEKGQGFSDVWLLYKDSKDNMWISSTDGLCKIKSSGVWEYLLPHPIMYIYEDKNSDLWTAFNNSQTGRNFSLYRFNGSGFAKVMDDPSDWGIFGIVEDSNRKIWFGNGRGVVCLSPAAAENACLKKTCHHDLPLREAIEEHDRYLARAYTTFKR